MRWLASISETLLLRMTCREFVEHLRAYLDGELPAMDRAELDLHLAECSACRDYRATYERTIELTKLALADDSAELPADVPPELVAAILAARKRR